MSEHSKFYALICLALGGCLDAADTEPGSEADEPTTGATEQAVANSHFDQHSFGGDIAPMPFAPYVTQQFSPLGDCTPGFVRPVRPSVQWTSAGGGWCQFMNWNTGDAHDCRAVIFGSTGGAWFGGTCTSNIQEVPEMHGQQGVFSFNRSNTASATVNTTDYAIALNAGQTLTATVCGELGSSFAGDTYLRLFDVWGRQSWDNDDACGAGSRLVFTATSGGSFQIHTGCYQGGSCNGTVAWFIQ